MRQELKNLSERCSGNRKEEIDKVMAKVSFNYQDEKGITYILIKQILESQFKSLSGIKIEYENLKVEIKEKLATAEFDLCVIATIGNQTGYIIGDLKAPRA